MCFDGLWLTRQVRRLSVTCSAIASSGICACNLGGVIARGLVGSMASALEHAHTHSMFQGADVSPKGAAAVAHVEISPPRGVPVVSIPGDCGPVSGSGGNAGNYFFVRYYVDDGILFELQWWPDGRRCLRAVQSLASDHFCLLGERGVSDPPLLSARKITDWDTQLGVLGWIIDTETRTVTFPSISASSCKISLRSGPRLVHLLQRGRCRSSLAFLYMSPLLCVRGGFS